MKKVCLDLAFLLSNSTVLMYACRKLVHKTVPEFNIFFNCCVQDVLNCTKTNALKDIRVNIYLL